MGVTSQELPLEQLGDTEDTLLLPEDYMAWQIVKRGSPEEIEAYLEKWAASRPSGYERAEKFYEKAVKHQLAGEIGRALPAMYEANRQMVGQEMVMGSRILNRKLRKMRLELWTQVIQTQAKDPYPFTEGLVISIDHSQDELLATG